MISGIPLILASCWSHKTRWLCSCGLLGALSKSDQARPLNGDGKYARAELNPTATIKWAEQRTVNCRKDHISIRILHDGSEAQLKEGESRNHACRILASLWPLLAPQLRCALDRAEGGLLPVCFIIRMGNEGL